MRPVTFGYPLGDFTQYVMDSLREIENASNEGVFAVADGFTVSNFTVTRTLNAGTATTADIANFLATLIDDLQKRGPNRVE
jgi:hypothetical protein